MAHEEPISQSAHAEEVSVAEPDARFAPRVEPLAPELVDGAASVESETTQSERQDSLGLEFGMLRRSLPLVLPVDCVCGPNISWSRPSHPGSQSYGCNAVKRPQNRPW